MVDQHKNAAAVATPVMGHYDLPMWESIAAHRMALQCCRNCGAFRYPPGPACPKCLAEEADWKPLSGMGTIMSWVVFHRQYLPAYPAPYHAIAVKLEEGPVMISNLEGPQPEGAWIGQKVRIVYSETAGGQTLPRFRLDLQHRD